MRIVTLGAGTVGTWVSDLLCQRGHSVTVVDNDASHIRRINEELDVRALTGSASQSSILFQAGAPGADLCLALTGDDEVNIVAASMAKAMGSRRAVARVYAPVFRDLSTFDYQRHFSIDRLLSLEHLSAMELARHIRNPGSMLFEHFGRGALEVQEATVSEQSVAGQPVKALDIPANVRIGTISREGKIWTAGAEDVIEAGDRLTLIGEHEHVKQVKRIFQRGAASKLRVVIAGGGETGYHLTQALEQDGYDVLLMDEDSERCEFLSANLSRTTIIQADATRRAVLEEERVGTADVFVACTGDDENNIMSGVEAREIGAKKIMAIVGRPDYANVVNKLGIDVAVSERDVVARQVMGLLNTGCIVSRTAIPGGRISVFEIEVTEGSPATEHVLAKLRLPPNCLIAAVLREEYAHVPHADERLAPGDMVLVLMDEDAVEATLLQFASHL